MTIFTAPIGRLADDVVTLRLPSPDADDVTTVDNYIHEEHPATSRRPCQD